ncbi:MAG: TPM domain-containing protein [Cyclobacteriaceae bacterium]|nr:TPM domain-containing protein [Cyclobacteriaceae bacterium]
MNLINKAISLNSVMRVMILLVLLPILSRAQIYTIETTPNPKEQNNTYVSDPTYFLSRTTVDYLNDLLDSLESKTTAQVAVVVLPSIGTADITTFAQALFEKWGIGQRDNDNGLLILLVIDQRTIRFHTGYGVEGILPDVTCKRIQEEFMVPYFKKENYDEGLIEGVKVVSQLLADPEVIHEIYNTSVGNRKIIHVMVVIAACLFGFSLIIVFSESWVRDKFTPSLAAPRLTISIWWWLTLYILLPAAFFFYHDSAPISYLELIVRFYLLLLILFIERFIRIWRLAKPFIDQDRSQELYNYIQRQKNYWRGFSFFFPIPLLVFYFVLMHKAKAYRFKPRHCKRCGSLSKRLSEEEDDKLLNVGQQTEEKIKSIDYDVWLCMQCGATEILSYINANTEYKACESCTFVTTALVEKRTITPATYDNDGAGEEEYKCTHCGHRQIVPFVISQLRTSSSGSDGSSGGSSGGSFGGGSSGGGGASSSW